jgi:hypothetical protein
VLFVNYSNWRVILLRLKKELAIMSSWLKLTWLKHYLQSKISVKQKIKWLDLIKTTNTNNMIISKNLEKLVNLSYNWKQRSRWFGSFSSRIKEVKKIYKFCRIKLLDCKKATNNLVEVSGTKKINGSFKKSHFKKI